MNTFRDNDNVEWGITLNAKSVRGIREQYGIDPLSEEGCLRLFDDDVLLVEVVALACSDECARRNTSEADLMASITGDAIERARSALWSAIFAFCPSQKRDILRDMLAKLSDVRTAAYANIARLIASPEFGSALIADINQKTDTAFSDLLARVRES